MAALLSMLVAGCASSGDWSHFDDGSLDSWLVRDAAPAYIETLSSHPRFRKEVIHVAVVSGDRVQLRTDALSASLRDAIHSRLLAVPNLKLVLQDSPASCEPVAGGYLLGLELVRNPGGNAQVSLRLYDNVEQQWVGGFNRQWQGRLTTPQLKLAARPAVSEDARGLRVLPYDADQSDLLAAHLARALACDLRRDGADEQVIQPARHGAAALVAGNLAGEQRLTVGSRGQLLLDTRIHKVDSNLYQVWAVLSPTGSASGQSYTASAYATAPLLRKPPTQSPKSRPKPAPDSTTMVVAADQPPRALLGPIAIAPGDRCVGPRGKTVFPEQCFALEFDSRRDTSLFVIARDTELNWLRLHPSNCHPGGLTQGKRADHRFPQRDAIGWDRRLGTETFFVIAAQRGVAAQRIGQLISELPAGCDSRRRIARDWHQRFEALLDRLDHDAAVEQLRVRYEAGPRRRHAGT
ncbi:MAG: hypothetical protein HKN49_13065 [Gammaproteobacteria bacterium]|nr:hypothetical protein [Gammaproteobacteria bacterium]